MHVMQGNDTIEIDIVTDEYSNSINIVVEHPDKAKRIRFHYQYDCLIRYVSQNQKEPILKRAILKSRYDLESLSRGNLKPMPNAESQYYKIVDISAYTASQDIVIQINKLKN